MLFDFCYVVRCEVPTTLLLGHLNPFQFYLIVSIKKFLIFIKVWAQDKSHRLVMSLVLCAYQMCSKMLMQFQ